MTAIYKAKCVKVRDPDAGAVLLHPRVGSHLAANFLVNGAGVLLFSELVRHGTAKYEPLRHAARLDMDEDAEIEAALQPFLGRQDGAAVILGEAKMVLDHSCDQLPPVPEPLPEALGCVPVLYSKEKVAFFRGSRLE